MCALQLLLPPAQVLIFSQFTRMLDILEDYLTAAQYPCERIDGSVSLRDRQAAIDRYSKGEPGCHYEAGIGMLPARRGQRRSMTHHVNSLHEMLRNIMCARRTVQPAALCGSHRACTAVMCIR